MSKPKVGCQPIIFGRHAEYDLERMLRAIADAGYDGLETGPSKGPEEDARFRELLEETGLCVLGVHTSFTRLDDFDAIVDYVRSFGAELLMVSGVGDRSEGAPAYAKGAAVLNERGRQAAAKGVKLCYHNHSWEFKDAFAEGCGMDILLRELDPEAVKLCVDVYWVYDGGRDPAEFIDTWQDRVATVHLKDRKDDTFAEVGQGVIDFPAIFRAIEPLNLRWVVTEQDRTDRDPAVSIKMSRDYLRDVIGV